MRGSSCLPALSNKRWMLQQVALMIPLMKAPSLSFGFTLTMVECCCSLVEKAQIFVALQMRSLHSEFAQNLESSHADIIYIFSS